jgi:lysophospholipase L1-like esterase
MFAKLLIPLIGLTLAVSARAQTLFPRFADEIAAFESADKLVMPKKGGVLFLGSSSIRLWTTLSTDFPGSNVINRGFGGSEVADSVTYVDRIVVPYAPKTIVFYAGDNDIGAGKSPEQVYASFVALTKKIRAKLPSVRILFISIKPSLSRWDKFPLIQKTNGMIQAYTMEHKMSFIDVVPAMLGPDGKPRAELYRPDGLHMTPAGYVIWRDAVRPYLGEAVRVPAKPVRVPAKTGV